MNTATHDIDLPQDLADLTERCKRRLFERLEGVLDACENLDNPKNVSATLRAVSLLLRLCTSIRRPAAPPRPREPAHPENAPTPAHNGPPAHFTAHVAPIDAGMAPVLGTAPLPDHAALATGFALGDPVSPQASRLLAVPGRRGDAGRADLSLIAGESPCRPHSSALLASRAGLALGPGS